MAKTIRNKRVLREPRVEDKTGLSRVTIWRLEQAGLFPARIRLTDGAVGWLESDIDDWIDQKVSNSRSEATV